MSGSRANLESSLPSSGHLYFTLKDSQSQLGVLGHLSPGCGLPLQEGLSVIARGRISVYEARGEYQLIVDLLDPQGVGAFQLAFRAAQRGSCLGRIVR